MRPISKPIHDEIGVMLATGADVASTRKANFSRETKSISVKGLIDPPTISLPLRKNETESLLPEYESMKMRDSAFYYLRVGIVVLSNRVAARVRGEDKNIEAFEALTKKINRPDMYATIWPARGEVANLDIVRVNPTNPPDFMIIPTRPDKLKVKI